MSVSQLVLPLDPTAALRTVLKWIADSLSPEDVEAIHYINSLSVPADQRTALGVLRELEKKGVFSLDNIEPLVRQLTNINRCDIINCSWFEDFRRASTERRTKQDSLTSPARGYTDSSVAQHPTSEHEASPSLSLVTLPSNAATKDMLLQSLMADPVTRTKMVAMLREDLTVARSSSYNTLGGNPSRRRTQTDSDTSLKWLSLEGRSRSLGTIGVGSIPPQPCSTTLQTSDDPCQPNTTFSQISADPPSQASDDPPLQASDDPPSQASDDPPSQASDDPPSQASDDPIESRAAIHQTPTDPPQSHNINQQTPDGATFSPLSSEGQLRKESRESSSSQASSSLGVGSPVPLQSNAVTKQQQCSSPMPSQQQREGTLPQEPPLQGTVQEELQHGIPKASLSWKIKREEIGTRILKHMNKSFTKELKMKVDGYRCKPVKLAFRLHPNGIGHDSGNAMTLEVTVTVRQRCSELKEMAQLRMDIKTQIGQEFVSVKELTQRLENFLVHDFLPHEIIQQTHAKYTEIEFEGCIIFDIVDPPPTDGIEPWPSDSRV